MLFLKKNITNSCTVRDALTTISDALTTNVELPVKESQVHHPENESQVHNPEKEYQAHPPEKDSQVVPPDKDSQVVPHDKTSQQDLSADDSQDDNKFADIYKYQIYSHWKKIEHNSGENRAFPAIPLVVKTAKVETLM